MALPVVVINPNLRLGGRFTLVDLDEDVVGGPLLPDQEVEVREPSSGLVGRGRVVAFPGDGTCLLLVDWGGLRLEEGE